jgi:nitrite reductase/ring-hydroxylating ferredoxin subunit
MPQKHRACSADEIPPGTGKEFTLRGRIVAIFHADGAFYAIDGICAHAGGPLGKGELQGTVVTCPWHGWQYDVQTGNHCLSPQICQNRYAVTIEDGEIFVEV